MVLIWLVSGLASFLFNKLFPRRGVFSFLMKAEFVFLKWLSGDVARESVRSNNESESAALSWLALLLLQVTYTHGKYKFCRVIHTFKQHIFITYLCFNISHCCFNFVHTLVCNVLLVLDVYSLSFRPPWSPHACHFHWNMHFNPVHFSIPGVGWMSSTCQGSWSLWKYYFTML